MFLVRFRYELALAAALSMGGFSPVAFAQLIDFSGLPRPKLAGFTPYVAITVSDERETDEFEWEHRLESGYVGSPIAGGSAATNYSIGVLDTGASVDLIGRQDTVRWGITGDQLTPNFSSITGSAGTVEVPISQPMGFFAQGLGAIDESGRLDTTQLVGHSNVSTIALDANSTDPELDAIPSVVGIPMLAFYTSVIRNDTPRTINFEGTTVTSPDVQILEHGDPAIPELDRSIPLNFGSLVPASTSAYYALDFDEPFDFTTPTFPTLLTISAGSLPTGGAFFSKVNLGNGDIGPLNPVREYNMLLDTGAQASIISQGVAAEMNIDLRNPVFTIDVAGIGGIIEDVPGFYVDYARINAAGGAVEWTKAPFLVLDLPNPDGVGTLPGVLGMNFFWNRNIVFEPTLTGSSFFHISDPLFGPEVLNGDLDLDLDRDANDINDLFAKRGEDLETADPAIYDLNRDDLIDDNDVAFWVGELMETVPGDTNLDGNVSLTDFATLRANFGPLDQAAWDKGDYDGNSSVDLVDFAQLRANFGFSAAAVPEPTSLACLALATIGLGMVRRVR